MPEWLPFQGNSARELPDQISAVFSDLGAQMHPSSAGICGGVGVYPQARKLRKGVEILVACPGRAKKGGDAFPFMIPGRRSRGAHRRASLRKNVKRRVP